MASTFSYKIVILNYPVPVDPDPAEDIEHIDDFRDPREDGDDGGV